MTVQNPAFHLVFSNETKAAKYGISHRKTIKMKVSRWGDNGFVLRFDSVSKVHRQFGKQSKFVPVRHKPLHSVVESGRHTNNTIE